ncbi:hypothetical protein [Sphingomonas sp. TDK1]|uniref:hypothetical protein n=1 Tax=Sphingomonas sp. TDK1 TaxID=453247 RepID=UPI001E2DE3DD|nr:hypothetical protein [Sphingomonas sp. TDK1]
MAGNVGEDGLYENVSEYVRDLIRREGAGRPRRFPRRAAAAARMSRYQLSPAAKGQIAEIYAYTHATWGRAQADRY